MSSIPFDESHPRFSNIREYLTGNVDLLPSEHRLRVTAKPHDAPLVSRLRKIRRRMRLAASDKREIKMWNSDLKKVIRRRGVEVCSKPELPQPARNSAFWQECFRLLKEGDFQRLQSRCEFAELATEISERLDSMRVSEEASVRKLLEDLKIVRQDS